MTLTKTLKRNFKEIVQNEAIFDILVASHVFTKLERCDDETLDEPESSRDFDPFGILRYRMNLTTSKVSMCH